MPGFTEHPRRPSPPPSTSDNNSNMNDSTATTITENNNNGNDGNDGNDDNHILNTSTRRLSLADSPPSPSASSPSSTPPQQPHQPPSPEAQSPHPTTPPSSSQQQPPPLSPRSRQIQIRNRRLHYLATHSTTYFHHPDLELADPLLYDACIRAFQTPAEREADGKAKGWSGILHADLERAEARMAALRRATSDEGRHEPEEEDEDGHEPDPAPAAAGDEEGGTNENDQAAAAAERTLHDDKPANKAEGLQRWKDAMTRRFLEGRDDDVDYPSIDDAEEYDDRREMERDAHDAYFDAETPDAAACSTDTGVQDF